MTSLTTGSSERNARRTRRRRGPEWYRPRRLYARALRGYDFQQFLSVDLHSPWWIGPIEVPTRVVLAPMAGVSVQAFRRQGRRFGAGLVCSEMVSCAGLHHR